MEICRYVSASKHTHRKADYRFSLCCFVNEFKEFQNDLLPQDCKHKKGIKVNVIS